MLVSHDIHKPVSPPIALNEEGLPYTKPEVLVWRWPSLDREPNTKAQNQAWLITVYWHPEWHSPVPLRMMGNPQTFDSLQLQKYVDRDKNIVYGYETAQAEARRITNYEAHHFN